MRYRGGGVGHLYMRAVEVWLTETGWGADDTLIYSSSDLDMDSEDNEEDGNKDPGDRGEDTGDGGSDGEVSSEDVSSGHTTESDPSSDGDPDTLYATDSDDEDGKYRFTGL